MEHLVRQVNCVNDYIARKYLQDHVEQETFNDDKTGVSYGCMTAIISGLLCQWFFSEPHYYTYTYQKYACLFTLDT